LDDKFDLSKAEKAPEIDENRRAFMKLLPDALSKAGEGPADEVSDGIAGIAEQNSVMSRRSILALPIRVAAAAIIAKIAFLLPKEADAYSVDNFTREILAQLDPSQVTNKDFELLDSFDIPRPLLYFEHNVKGKIEKNGANIPTPSLVFEVAKLCWRFCKDKVANIEIRRQILVHLKDVASQGHRDRLRILQIHQTMTKMDEKNKASWQPLVAQSYAVVKLVEALVNKEYSAAKSLKAGSPNQELASFAIPMAPRKDHQDDYDNYEEVLPDTRPNALFTFECGKLPAYNDKPRPQTNSSPTEAAFLLKNVAKIYYEAAYRRHEACKNILAAAVIEPNKKTKADLIKAAHEKTSLPIRDGWAAAVNEDGIGKTGIIIELVKSMVNAARGEMERAYRIDRCAPEEFPSEEDYIFKATEYLEKVIRAEEQ
jgi:hypothetical protein